MAWLCSGETNEELVENMRRAGMIESHVIAEAMKRVDRANYVKFAKYAYQDAPQSIGSGATISAPHMHAHASQHLLPYIHPDAHILDVGSGSGYTVAVFHHLIKTVSAAKLSSVTSPSSTTATSLASGQLTPAVITPTPVSPGSIRPGVVVGIDHIKDLVDWSVANLKRDGLGEAIEKGEIVMVAGDGRKGWEEAAPYDVIHVGAAAPEVPQKLVEMLKSPGRMFIPVGPDGGIQAVWTIDKDEMGNVKKTKLFGVRYVPLTDEAKQIQEAW